MVDKKQWHEEDDNLWQKVEEDQEVYLDSINDFEGFDIIGAGAEEEAENPLDQGRGCPYCGGLIKYLGMTKAGQNTMVYCGDCKRNFYIDDVNYQSEVVDELYRTIPKSLIQRFDEYSKKRKQTGN